MSDAVDSSGLREPGLGSLLVELLQDADLRLSASHKWLVEHEAELRRVIEGRFPLRGNLMLLRRINEHFESWVLETCWFFKGTGRLSFNTICESMGIDLDAAREQRAHLQILPVSARQLWDALEALSARV